MNGVLTIDIGASFVKSAVSDHDGVIVGKTTRLATPRPATHAALLAACRQIAANSGAFSRATVGFPGHIVDGCVLSAPNLDGDDWIQLAFEKLLADALACPVRLLNDADLHGYGAMSGEGLELVMTLGTGFGTSVFSSGRRLPHFEFGRFPFYGSHDGGVAYLDAYVGTVGARDVR